MFITIKLKELIEIKGISQHELSRMSGIRQASINDMCQNKTKRMPLDNIAKICDSLNCEISDILAIKKEPND